jgi:hypothetical protein
MHPFYLEAVGHGPGSATFLQTLRRISALRLARYFKCLTAIETRFPISQEKGHARINFPWYDAFRPSKKTTQSNIHFEKAAVLFNIAAVLGQQALQVERGTSDGIKQVPDLLLDTDLIRMHDCF